MLSNLNEIDITKKIIIFGAGNASTVIANGLESICGVFDYCFCDNDVNRQNLKLKNPIYSLEESLLIENTIYLVAFLENDFAKINVARECLQKNAVDEKDIVVVDMTADWIQDISWNKLCSAMLIKQEQEKLNKVDKIVFLASGFTPETEKKAGGGPIGVMCMLKKTLGDSYKNISLEYPYLNFVVDKDNFFNKYLYITGLIETISRLVSAYKDTVYIANDVYVAYALLVMGKQYILVHHGQGDVVKERLMRGELFSEEEKTMLYDLEIKATKKALKVLFPSCGAEKYFKESFMQEISYKLGKPLYNTVYEKPLIEIVENIKKEEGVTFFSVGQMTHLKGMDKVPDFIRKYASSIKKKIRWIVVADGVLRETVANKMKGITDEFSNVEYINITYKLTRGQIFYLMDIADVYLMLHRVSIFDFATLEAMYCGKPIILSNIPGNKEFNVNNNILMYDESTIWDSVYSYIEDGMRYGKMNMDVYENFFSKQSFVKQYYKLFDDLIDYVREEEMD